MASAVLMQQQHHHQQNYHFTPHSSLMGKLPFPTHNHNNNNNNSSLSHQPPRLKPHHHHHQLNNGHQNHKQNQNDKAPDDATSFTNNNININNIKPSFSTYININLSTYTKPELKTLKSRLISELNQVRSLSSRIQNYNPNPNPNPKKRKSPSPSPAVHVAPPHVMGACRKVLTRILKTKNSLWFKTPVDAVGLGLHDYHSIVKQPMDLGTVKKKLEGGVYRNPEEFASDVRLTFENAVLYNPVGHEVHVVAAGFLDKFDGYFRDLWVEYQDWVNQQEPRKEQEQEEEEMVVVVPKMPSPESPKVVEEEVVVVKGKLPKPKAKDPNKREMSMEEKHKLGAGLQSLPEEKMSQVIGIIRKRNGHLAQDGDEIELDIEAIDKETLWELDRFVTNYKKFVSKIKRQALMGFPGNIMNESQNNDNNNNNHDNHEMVVDEVGGSERVMEVAAVGGGKVKKGGGGGGDLGGGEEDVDIGDEMPVHNFPPLEIEKDDDNRQQQPGGGGGGGGDSDSESSSSSSSSDDSSSSDSDSGSSSGSDSDVDDAQSRDNESKNIHH